MLEKVGSGAEAKAVSPIGGIAGVGSAGGGASGDGMVEKGMPSVGEADAGSVGGGMSGVGEVITIVSGSDVGGAWVEAGISGAAFAGVGR